MRYKRNLIFRLLLGKNECLDGSNDCSLNADCHNTFGSYTCSCKYGFSGNGFKCVSKWTGLSTTHIVMIDKYRELEMSEQFLDIDHLISRTLITHVMLLLYLFLDIDECTKESHNCNINANCTDTPGSYICSCKSGFVGDGFNCASENSI